MTLLGVDPRLGSLLRSLFLATIAGELLAVKEVSTTSLDSSRGQEAVQQLEREVSQPVAGFCQQ